MVNDLGLGSGETAGMGSRAEFGICERLEKGLSKKARTRNGSATLLDREDRTWCWTYPGGG